MDSGAAERIDTDTFTCAANRVQAEHTGKIARVGLDEIVAVRRGSAQGVGKRYPFDSLKSGLQKFVGFRLDPAGNLGVGRTPVGWVVFESAIARRIMRRR